MQSSVQIVETMMARYEISELKFEFSDFKGYPTVDFIIYDKNHNPLYSDIDSFTFNDALNKIAKFFINARNLK